MGRHRRELQSGGWQVNSVYVRKRDGPARVEQAYRTLVEDRVPPERVLSDGKEQGDAGGDLRAGVHRASGAGADD
jgi:hypothetical protein